jgi:hypothetical protein
MQRLKIHIRKPGQDREETIVLGRIGSVLVSLLMVLLVTALVATTIVFGYLVLGMMLAALLIGMVIAMIRGAFQGLRR